MAPQGTSSCERNHSRRLSKLMRLQLGRKEKSRMGRNSRTETTEKLAAVSRELAIEYRHVADLTPFPGNSRKHHKKQVRQIAKSIEVFGFNVPLLINAHSQVMAGHGRLLACKLLGITEVPTIRLEHLTE